MIIMEIILNTSWDAVMINVGLARAHPHNPANYKSPF